jgi:hypothetical protein
MGFFARKIKDDLKAQKQIKILVNPVVLQKSKRETENGSGVDEK